MKKGLILDIFLLIDLEIILVIDKGTVGEMSKLNINIKFTFVGM